MRKIIAPELVQLSNVVLDAAYALHTQIGPGCLEKVYEVAFAKVLSDMGHVAERQVAVPFEFRGERLPVAFRADIIVDDALVLELKAASQMLPVHRAQLRTYLHLSQKPVGLLLCFGAEHLRDAYDRVVHPDYVFLPPSRRPTSTGTTGDTGPREQPSAATPSRATWEP